MKINCNYCKVKFNRSVGAINQNKKRKCKNYCSRSCYSNGISGKNHPMHNKKHSKKSREKMCLNHADFSGKNHPMYGKNRNLRGVNNPNWKGGITPKNAKERQAQENKQFIQKIFKRDNYICKICNEYGHELHVDHIMA